MEKKKRKYNPNNCGRRIIAEFTDKFGTHIVLMAHHAFNWAIYKDIDGRIEIMQLPREKARKEYKRLEKIGKPTH